MSAIVVRRRVECASDVCTIWRVVTDTERLNRGAGLQRIHVAPLTNATAARYLMTTNLGGFDVKYEERPYEWREFEHFGVERRIRSGPITELTTTFDLAPKSLDGSTVDVTLALVPRYRALRPILYFAATQSVRKLAREIARMDGASPQTVRASQPSHADLERLGRAEEALATHVPPDLAKRMAALVRDARDNELARLRPYELAEQWSLDRRTVLAASLHAVASGLLDLRWDIVCPSCRTAASSVPKLSDLPPRGHCQLCDLGFDLDLDRAVEATFTPSRAIRAIDEGPYCIGGPARTPHVVAQGILPVKGTAPLRAPKEEGRFKLFVRGGASAPVVVRAGGPTEVTVTATDELVPASFEIAPAGVIHVVNGENIERHAKLERTSWRDLAATAHEVSALGVFRRLFSSEVLGTGTVLKVARVGLLFTDLTASTALYARAGDAAAYRLVHDHFVLLGEIIERHGGTIVKTIGDAVMAAFVDELCGLDAAREMLEAFDRFRASRAHCDAVFLKLGLFAGGSYVVGANGALDYFGQTVNVAARLQATARSSEIVVDEDLAERARAAGRLDGLEEVESFDAVLKGVDAPVRCVRLQGRHTEARATSRKAEPCRGTP